MIAPSNWPRNRLLLALPPSHLKRLMPELEHIECQRGQVLMDADSSLDHVFFPDSGVVSVVAVYEDGNIIEMATIGREGCTGVQAVLGAKSSSVRLLVQIPGTASKMPRAAFMRAMKSVPSFRSLMYAYVQAFLEQVLVSVACNGVHSLNQRLARWLLMMRDRSDDDALPITQSLLAEMLGVQRPSVTNAAIAKNAMSPEPVLVRIRPIRSGPNCPPRLPIELIHAMPAAAADARRNAVGIAQNVA